jgi:hypothetical protein
MGIEHESSGQWDDTLSSALDDAAQPSLADEDADSLHALLIENARLRNLAIQLSNLLGDLPTQVSGAPHSQGERV